MEKMCHWPKRPFIVSVVEPKLYRKYYRLRPFHKWHSTHTQYLKWKIVTMLLSGWIVREQKGSRSRLHDIDSHFEYSNKNFICTFVMFNVQRINFSILLQLNKIRNIQFTRVERSSSPIFIPSKKVMKYFQHLCYDIV